MGYRHYDVGGGGGGGKGGDLFISYTYSTYFPGLNLYLGEMEFTKVLWPKVMLVCHQ